MTRYPEIRQLSCLIGYLTGTGAQVLPVLDPTNGVGVTLGANTYYFPIGGERYGSMVEAVMQSIAMTWPSNIVATVTLEVTNFPKTVLGTDTGPADVTDWDSSGKWVQYNPTVGGANYVNASGTGTWTNYSLGITAGVGSAIANVQDIAFSRMRVKVVAGTGGFFRVMSHSKLGS